MYSKTYGNSLERVAKMHRKGTAAVDRAEFVAAREDRIVHKPADLTFGQAAAVPVVYRYGIVPISRGFSVVIVEQATESFTPSQRAIGRVIIGRLDKHTAKTLMRALSMIVSDELADEFS